MMPALELLMLLLLLLLLLLLPPMKMRMLRRSSKHAFGEEQGRFKLLLPGIRAGEA